MSREELLVAADDIVQLGESGRRLGHRSVQAAMFREAGLRPSRDAVLESLREHDPQALEARLEDILPRRLYDVVEAMIIWHVDSTQLLSVTLALCVTVTLDHQAVVVGNQSKTIRRSLLLPLHGFGL